MEFYIPETEIEQIQELTYNLPLFEDEYELSININEFFLELKLKQKNIISNHYFLKKLDIQTINQLFWINFKKIEEAFYFLYILIKEKNVKLLNKNDKNIISLNFKSINDKNREQETNLELSQKKQLTNNEIICTLLDEVNSLKKKFKSQNEKSIGELIDSKIEESKK